MSSDLSKPAEDRRFVVFSSGTSALGIAAESVIRILASGGKTDTAQQEPTDARWLVLQADDGSILSPVEIEGTLRIVTLKPSQIVPLPALCGRQSHSPTSVAIQDDSVLFLIVSPSQLPQKRAAHVETQDGTR